MVISLQLFENPNKIFFLQVPFCEISEKRSKNVLNRFSNFTNEKFKLIIRWNTQNLKSLFPLKIKIYILHVRFIKKFVFANQPMLVK